ncbi:MAG: ATP-binding protein [Rubrivivax sp.]|nr:ATP-binding protein [Rubrivivax sp.]
MPAWYGSQSRPTLRQLEAVLRLLRPDFEYTASARNDVELAEAAIRRFTDEQFEAIDHLEDNRRVLFKGPAGTGKTFLAIEAARRAVRAGRTVALLCFNSLLASWLKHEAESIAQEAKARALSFYVGFFRGSCSALPRSTCRRRQTRSSGASNCRCARWMPCWPMAATCQPSSCCSWTKHRTCCPSRCSTSWNCC